MMMLTGNLWMIVDTTINCREKAGGGDGYGECNEKGVCIGCSVSSGDGCRVDC